MQYNTPKGDAGTPQFNSVLAVAQQLETRVQISRNAFCFAIVNQVIMTSGPSIWMNRLLDSHLVTNLRFQERCSMYL